MSFITAVLGAQMSKTDGVMLNDIGRTMDDDPRPILYIGPTRKNVESLSNERLSAMIRSVPSLLQGLAGGQKDKTTEKHIHGVRVGLGWAGSATELASHPAAKVYIDERDRMDDIPGEGDVNGLAGARVATYDGQVITTSTPLLGDVVREWDDETGLDHWVVGEKDDIHSPTWLLWQDGSRNEWAIPCLECREYFIPWSDLLIYDEKGTPDEVFRNTTLVCPRCGCDSKDSDKAQMNARGVFVAPGQWIKEFKKKDTCAVINKKKVRYGDYLETENESHVSFWVSGLCSPWRTYGHRTRELIKAQGEPGKEQPAVNTGFGELYKPKGSAPDWEIVKDLKRPYEKGLIPEGVMVLTCGVDVQKHSLYYSARGWGVNYGSWLIEEDQIFGLTNSAHVWDELAEVLNTSFGDLAIKLMLVDAGYSYKEPDERPEESIIYKFCRENPRAKPAKGYDYRSRTHNASNIDVSVDGKIVKGGLQMWHLDGDFFKSFIYSRLAWPEDQKGGWFLHKDTPDEYCRQLVSESRVMLSSGRVKWEKIRDNNHYLDCEMMNVGAAHILRLHRLREEAPKPQKGRRVISKGINQ